MADMREEAGKGPLNILFITVDQWRGDCLSALGHPVVKTPHLDALAQDAVLFERHYANTLPCGPSRATMHTGLYLQNHRSGTNGTPLDARHTNWALELRAAGWDPVLFGYTDTSPDPRGMDALDPRLTTYEGLLPGIRPVVQMDERAPPWCAFLREKGYEVPEDERWVYGHRDPGPDYEHGAPHPRPLAYPAEDDDTAFVTNAAMDYMREAKEPFACHLSILRPHPPFIAPEPWNAMYDPAGLPDFVRRATPEEEGAQHPWLAHQLSRKLFRASSNEKKLCRLKACYYGLMSRVDDEMGRLVAFLKETGLYDRTLIIFTSDHGEEMGDHWLIGKCGYFEGSYRVPMIIRDPSAAADAARGSRVTRFTEHVDVMPTMLAYAGLPVPEVCDGNALTPFVTGDGAPAWWRTEAHWEYDFRDPLDPGVEKELGLTLHQCALNVVRGERYKYVHFAGLPPLLFDLEADPHEFEDISGHQTSLPVMLDYAQKLVSWRMTHDEQALTHIVLTSDGAVARPAHRYDQNQ